MLDELFLETMRFMEQAIATAFQVPKQELGVKVVEGGLTYVDTEPPSANRSECRALALPGVTDSQRADESLGRLEWMNGADQKADSRSDPAGLRADA